MMNSNTHSQMLSTATSKWGLSGVSCSVLLSLTALGSFAQAQGLPEILMPAELTSPAAETSKPKFRPVGSALIELQDRFVRLPVSQQNEPEVQLVTGMVTIEAIASGSVEALLGDLQRLGLQGGAAFGNLVSGKFPLSAVSSASVLSTLRFISLARSFGRVGAASNQADQAMLTMSARSIFGVDGTGVTVGILSDSYNQLGGEAADITSGDLPIGVTVLDDTAIGPNSDEGRAMAQLIHDIAPGADLLFHTAFNGRPDFAQGIIELANAGADIIVDDIGYFSSPFFQDGPVSQAVDQVVADGVVYFSAAGNADNNSYEAPYVDSGLAFNGGAFPVTNTHAFAPADNVQEFQLNPGQSLLLSVQWDQPFASSGGIGSANDVDAFLVDASFGLLTESVNGNIGGDAVEIIFYQNNTSAAQMVGLVVGVFSGQVPGVLKWINFEDDVTPNHATNSSTIFAHPNSAGAIAVGAAQYDNTPEFGVAPPIIEPFSSLGGLGVLFDSVGNPIAVDDRDKPDITAPDGVDTTFFSSGDFDNTGFPNFFGTSAAAPNAAALAALQLECESNLSPAEIRMQQISTATDMGIPGFDNISGAGLVSGVDAVGLACGPSGFVCNGLAVDVFIGAGDVPTNNADVILGTAGVDVINGLSGDDTICGLSGDDIINAGGGDDWVDGGLGNDDIFGGGGNDSLYAGPGDDIVNGSSGDDDIEGDAGDDTLFGQVGDDTIDGGSGVDSISGGPGSDTIFTGSGATVGSGVFVTGGGGGDFIFGGSDADFLKGGGGADTIRGGDGDDVITGGVGRDTIDGEGGNDDIKGQGSRDTLNGGTGSDTITGGSQNDIINGGSGSDMLTGGSGDDELNGEAGSDTILGGSGDDNMDGGPSVGDSCDGQSGLDTASGACETVAGVP